MTQQILVVGAGAIGGILCAYLESAGHPVSLFARGDNADQIARQGVHLTTPDQRQLHVRPRVVTDAAALTPYDLVILATKSFSLPAALQTVAAAIGPATTVMPVVNGVPWWFGTPEAPVRAVDPEGRLAAAVPYERLVGATSYTPTRRAAPTEWVHSGASRLVIGAAARGGDPARAQAVAALFTGSVLTTAVAADLHQAIWTKFMTNASFNVLCALTGARQCDVAADAQLGPVARQIMAEVEALAIASGSSVTGGLDAPMQFAVEKGQFKPSTLQDLEAGRPLEIAALVDAPLELAERLGLPMPALRVAGAALRLKATTNGLLP